MDHHEHGDHHEGGPPAKKMNMIHEPGDDGDGHNSASGGGGLQQSMQIGAGTPLTVRIMVPSGVVGNVIGKKGDTLRHVRAETNCTLKMSRNEEGTYPGTHERVLRIQGTLAGVQRAIMMIREKINEKLEHQSLSSDPFDHHGVHRKQEIKLVVPNTSAGVVIGKSGSSIREIREASGSNIQVYPKAGSAEATRSAERIITVSAPGDMDLCTAVTRVLEKIASDPGHASGPETFNAASAAVANATMTPGMRGTSAGGGHMQQTGGGGGGPLTAEELAIKYETHGHALGGVMHAHEQHDMAMQRQGSSMQHRHSALGVYDSGASSVAKSSNGGVKFNPLEGVGNMEVLAFLDSLQSTLRQSGFSEQAVAEIMQAMQVLAKYNIMGLGLGLGVAAMAQMRGSQQTQQQQQPQQQTTIINEPTYVAAPPVTNVQQTAQSASVGNISTQTQQQLEALSKYGQLSVAQQQAVASLLGQAQTPPQTHSVNVPPMAAAEPAALSVSQAAVAQSQQFITSVPPPTVSQSAVGALCTMAPSGNGAPVTQLSASMAMNTAEDMKMVDIQSQMASWASAMPQVKSRQQLDPNKLELEVNETLLPCSETLSSVQRFSGCAIDTSRRSSSDPAARLIVIQGEADSVRAAKVMIERIVADENERRAQQRVY